MALSIIYLKKYNNYFNRTLKIDSLTDLATTYVVRVPATGTSGTIQFNPNDGIDTELVMDITEAQAEQIDYLVEAQGSAFTRWFILDAIRIRLGQYRLKLHRDVMADYYDDYKNAPAMIERATPLSVTDPTIFNLEGNSYNQVKQSQINIADTGCPWLVGYINKKLGTVKFSYDDVAGTYQDFFNEYPFKDSLNKDRYKDISSYSFNLGVRINGVDNYGKYDPERFSWARFNTSYGSGAFSANGSVTYYNGQDAIDQDNQPTLHYMTTTTTVDSTKMATSQTKLISGLNANKSLILSAINEMNNAISDSEYALLSAEDGKVYYDDATQKYYQVTVSTTTLSGVVPVYNSTIDNYITSTARAYIDNIGTIYSSPFTETYYFDPDKCYYAYGQADNNYEITYGGIPRVYMYVSEYTPANNTTISTTRNHTTDAPYDIFYMPYGTYNGHDYSSVSMKAMSQIISQLSGSGYLYDAQLVPYCPKLGGPGTMTSGDEHKKFDYIKSGGAVVGWLYYATAATDNITKSGFTLNIGSTISDRKIQNECEFYRLCSPNWASVYEFSVAKNLDNITSFKISQTLKPYSPYIRVCPVFSESGLYKKHDNDATGLILGGDFSLPLLNDQWATYEYQHKNYQNSFDRQIKSLDISQDVARKEQNWNALTGIIGAATSGGITGLNVAGATGPAGAIGAAAGATLGAGLSVAGAVIDWENQEKIRKDTRSAMIDQFTYNLGNVRALPDTLTRVGAYNVDNKYFVQLEKYDATSNEKTWLGNLLTNQGYKIGVMSTIQTYKSGSSYIQGRFIKIPSLEGDSHVANVIANEFAKGVFV